MVRTWKGGATCRTLAPAPAAAVGDVPFSVDASVAGDDVVSLSPSTCRPADAVRCSLSGVFTDVTLRLLSLALLVRMHCLFSGVFGLFSLLLCLCPGVFDCSLSCAQPLDLLLCAGGLRRGGRPCCVSSEVLEDMVLLVAVRRAGRRWCNAGMGRTGPTGRALP